MKKLSLVLVTIALATGATFAQSNIGNVTESGQNQTATIGQTGILNKSYVTQSNNANTADVTQSNFNVSYNTYSDVKQSGEWNNATVKQISNGTLTGSNVIGTLKALVDQTGNYNKALQIQGPHGQQGISNAEIIQSGSNNDAFQNQVKYGNGAKIIQSGNWNIAKQAQDIELPEGAEGSFNVALIDQSGSGNLATQEQDGWANNASASQSGSNNISTQLQSPAWMSDATVSQSGNWNKASQTQSGSLNTAKIDQASSGNTAMQVQTAGVKRPSGYASINEAEIYQMGGDGNMATQTQTSPGGNVAVNMGIISQDGWSNTALQIQIGGDNLSTVSQTGNWNNATVTQSMSITQ